jgi:DNA-directed RNA polymerase I subunit RPA43
MSPPLDTEKIKKIKHKSDGKSNRKRTRETDEDLANTTPVPAKKHRPLDGTGQSTMEDGPAVQLDDIDDSPFYEITYSLYLPISPISYDFPLAGLCAEHLSPLILKYYTPFHGLILSYSNARLTADPDSISENEEPSLVLAKSVDEYAASFVWITADFLVFSPKRGNTIEGWINIQNQGNLGLLCWNFFNVHIERKRLPKDWTWVGYTPQSRPVNDNNVNGSGYGTEGQREEQSDGKKGVSVGEGYFQDANGKRVEGLLRFRVMDVENSGGLDRENNFVSIKGTMLTAEEEQALEEHGALRPDSQGRKIVRKPNGEKHSMRGPLKGANVGDPMDINASPQSKHDSIAN